MENEIYSLTKKDITFSSGLIDVHERWINSFFFHTKFSSRPFLVFELASTRLVEYIKVENRVGDNLIKQRAKSLYVSTSVDAFNWIDVEVQFDLRLEQGLAKVFNNVKYIRLSLKDPGIIHLKDVSVLYSNNILDFQKTTTHPVSLKYGYIENEVYYPTHNAGFFSICSTVLLDMASLGPIFCPKINALHSFDLFKNDINYDSWSEYFSEPIDDDKNQSHTNIFSKGLLHHSKYHLLDFEKSREVLGKYFRPSKKVEDRVNFFLLKYSIEYENTIVLNIRGTDKSVEIEPTPNEIYLKNIKDILKQNPEYKILIQTDQKQIRDYFIDALSEFNILFIEELPVTESKTGFHYLIKSEKQEFAIDMLSATLIMSRCKWVVTHTGNVAYWTILFRGNAVNVIQN